MDQEHWPISQMPWNTVTLFSKPRYGLICGMKRLWPRSKFAVVCCMFLMCGSAANAEGAKGVDHSPPNPFPFKNTGSPEGFLRDLYERYNISLAAVPEVQGRDAAALLDPELLALSNKERKLAGHEEGAFDANPICDCQDWYKVAVKMIAISDETQSGVTATVTVSLGTADPDSIFRYQLVHTGGQWRIHNILYKNPDADMVGILKHAIAQGY